MSIICHKITKIIIQNKIYNNNDIGKDDTIQVLQPYFHSGPYTQKHK